MYLSSRLYYYYFSLNYSNIKLYKCINLYMLEDTEQYHKDRFLDRLCFYLQMGRSIPSFRQLLEIEKLKITSFKKMLPTKKDKQEFDEIFDNVRLYTSYMGNASNPIPLESILMGAILHNYKQLLQLSN